MLVLALVKDVEIIGEAAAKLSNETQVKYPPYRGQALSA
jgi:uncharacterized protein with HEPN domain